MARKSKKKEQQQEQEQVYPPEVNEVNQRREKEKEKVSDTEHPEAGGELGAQSGTDPERSEGTKQQEQEQEEKQQAEDPMEKVRREIASLNDKYLRLYSEFENYRKRVSREKLDLMKNASEDLITSLLPVLDDFDRAINTLEEKGDDDPVAEGVRLIQNKLMGILMQKGLEPADAMGKEFDTDYHEAITSIPAPSKDMKGKIVDVTEKGYLLNGKVIRYAKVVVGA